MGFDFKARGAQHPLGGSTVGNPPICLVAGVALLDKVHLRPAWVGEDVLAPEIVVALPGLYLFGAANHGLEDEFAANFGYDLVESVERIAQVIEHAHEDDEVEFSGN